MVPHLTCVTQDPHIVLLLSRKAEVIYLWWLLGITKMAGHSFPVSLGLPRWRPCQIPDPGATIKCQNPSPGEGTLSQLPVGSPPWGLTLIGALLSCLFNLFLFLFSWQLGRLFLTGYITRQNNYYIDVRPFHWNTNNSTQISWIIH